MTSLDTEPLKLDGRVVLPGDPSWDQDRQAWNLAADQRPAMVAIAQSVHDIAQVVRFARRRRLRVIVQGTGHGASSLGPLDGTVLLRTSEMRGVHIDAARRRAHVRPGALWMDVTKPASDLGLAPLSGSSPDVGVVGYTLGGGLSWLGRRYGLAANSVLAIEVVTADGRVRVVDREREPELFWALRGGGGGFGVVTGLEFALYPARNVYAGALMWPWERSREVIQRWREWTRTAPREFTTSARIMQFPPIPDLPDSVRGRALVVIDGAFLGDEAAGGRWIASLRALRPETDTFGRQAAAYLSHMHMEPEEPVPALGGHALLDSLPAEAVDAFVDAGGPGSGSPLVHLELRHLGGALGEAPAGHGAIAQLDGEYALLGLGIPMDPGSVESIEAQIGRLTRAMAPWAAPRTYLNFTLDPTEAGRIFEPATYERLQVVKGIYDPDNVFRANPEITPAAQVARAA
jgi:FAD/FMN-containing dehydrogenase